MIIQLIRCPSIRILLAVQLILKKLQRLIIKIGLNPLPKTLTGASMQERHWNYMYIITKQMMTSRLIQQLSARLQLRNALLKVHWY